MRCRADGQKEDGPATREGRVTWQWADGSLCKARMGRRNYNDRRNRPTECERRPKIPDIAGKHIRNYDLDLDLIGELQEIPHTPPGRSGLGWTDGRINEEVSESGAITEETFGDIHRGRFALYAEMAGIER